MAAQLERTGSELLEVDISESGGGFLSEEESGVFVNSAAALQEDFSGYPRWSSPAAESPSDTSSPPGREEQLPGAGETPPPPPLPGTRAADNNIPESRCDALGAPRSSIVDCLLVELYETYSGRRNLDSWDSSTEASGSDAFLGRSTSGSSFLQELQEKHTRRHQMNYLAQKGEGSAGRRECAAAGARSFNIWIYCKVTVTAAITINMEF